MVSLKNIYLIHRQINSIFDFADGCEQPVTWTPYSDVYETPSSYYVVVEIPGLKEDRIIAEVQGSMVKVRGDRKTKREDCRYHQIERGCGGFSRSFTLPERIDSKEIKALLKDGILVIKISKEPEDSPIN